MIAVLVGYKDIKANLSEISDDAHRIFSKIKGLTDREFELLDIAVRLTLARIAESGERHSSGLTRRFARIRSRLFGESQEDIEIDVKNIEKERFW